MQLNQLKCELSQHGTNQVWINTVSLILFITEISQIFRMIQKPKEGNLLKELKIQGISWGAWPNYWKGLSRKSRP